MIGMPACRIAGEGLFAGSQQPATCCGASITIGPTPTFGYIAARHAAAAAR